MSTCLSCHQAIPFSCNRDDCHDQIIVVDGVPMSYQNHHKKHVTKKASGPGEMVFRKPSIVTDKERASFDAALEKAEKDG